MDQMNLVSLQWLPFFILFLIKTDRANNRRELLVNGGLASLFFLLNMMVDFYYAIYLVMFAGLYWLNRFRLLTFSQRNGPLTHRREKQKQGTPLPPPHTPSGAGEGVSVFSQEVRSAGQRILQSDTSFQEATFKPGTTITGLVKLTLKMGAIFGLAGLVFSPVLFATVRAISSKVYQPLENVTDSQVHSADLLNMWLPPAYLPTNRPTWFSEAAIWDTLKLNSAGAVMGYVTLALAIYALVKIKGLWFWGGAALFWLIIALGPTLRINGTETAVPLPYRLLVKLPIFNITRAPERFIVMAEISLAVLVAYAVAHLTARFNGWRRFASVTLVIALVYLELTPGFLAQPDKIGPFPFAQAIKAGNSPVAASQAILELPVTKHQNPDSPRMLYQIYHNRPIIGGYISRKLLDPYRQNDYVLFDFIQLRKDERDIVPRKTAEEWRGLLNYANMGYIVLYPDDFARTSDQQTAAQNLIDRALEKSGPFYQDDFVRVYQIGPGRLEKPVFVLTEGWNEPEIISRETGQVQRWLEEKEKPEELGARANIVVGPEVKLQESYTLQIEAASAFKPRRLQVLLNGVQLQEVMLQPGLNNFAISGLKLKPGDNFLLLRPNLADGYSIPAEINKDSKDNRKLRISVISMNLK